VKKENLMKKTVAVLILLATPTLAFAQAHGAADSADASAQTAKAESSSADASNTGEALKKVAREMVGAFWRGDKQALDRIFADTFLDTNSDGYLATKSQLIESVRPLPAGVELTFDIEDAEVREYGDVAVMAYRMVIGEEIYGRRLKQQFRVTDTFIQRGGRWQMIARQEGRIQADRVAAKIDPKIYEAYVGQYRLTPALILTVTSESGKLMVQRSGQSAKTELLPENETIFFIRGQQGERVFVKDEKGRVTHMIVRLAEGQEIKAEKIK
jgi:ketosteroid isomerase-like protein